MGEIAADAHTLMKGFKSSPIWPRLPVIESDMVVNEVAHRLNACPPRRRCSESLPSEIKKVAGNFAVPAGQQKRQDFDRYITDLVLLGLRHVRIWLTSVAN